MQFLQNNINSNLGKTLGTSISNVCKHVAVVCVSDQYARRGLEENVLPFQRELNLCMWKTALKGKQ